MSANIDNEMKCINDSSLNIEVYRKLVQTYLNMNLYTSALFWADKVVALSSGAAKDIYWLAQCMFLLKQYHRAAQVIRSRELEKTYVLCNYLVVRCLLEAHEHAEAMRVLNSMTIDIFQQNASNMDGNNTGNDGFFDDSPRNHIQSAVLMLKGKLLEAMDNRGLASECYRQALQFDVHCYEAYEALIQHQMLSAAEERELLDSVPISQQCNESEAILIKMLYESKLKKYHTVTQTVPDISANVTTSPTEDMLCVPSVTPAIFTLNAVSTPHNDSSVADNNILVSNSLANKLQGSLDFIVSQAEKLYYNCEYQRCKQVTESVLKKDPYHADCLPVHIACLVELKESNNLFSLAHKLVDLYPDLAIAWFAVGCYYYVIGKSDPSRRYLAKATTLDRLFGPAWLLYGHSFAVENEHDQAMAAYFKASQLMKGCHLPLLYIGLECGLTNNVRLAEKFFHQAQNIAPDDPFVMHEMGVIAFQNLDYKAAEKHFKDALHRIRNSQETTMVEKWEPLLNNLGHTCRKLKKYEESLDYHHQALVLSPQSAATYSAIGYTKALLGQTEEAVDWFHKTLALKRDDTFSSTMLNYTLEQLAEESPPFMGAPDFIPDFTSRSPKTPGQEVKFIYDNTSDAEERDTDSQAMQQDSMNINNDMSMSFEIEMPDVSGPKS